MPFCGSNFPGRQICLRQIRQLKIMLKWLISYQVTMQIFVEIPLFPQPHGNVFFFYCFWFPPVFFSDSDNLILYCIDITVRLQDKLMVCSIYYIFLFPILIMIPTPLLPTPLHHSTLPPHYPPHSYPPLSLEFYTITYSY